MPIRGAAPAMAVWHAALAVVLTGVCMPASAWGDEGHRILATIAYGRLEPAVRKAVDVLLAADTDPLTARDFVSRSTWADRWRDLDRNTTKKQYNATRHWHFADIELDGGSLAQACQDHPPLPEHTLASAGPAQACVVDKIDQFTAELRDPATTKAERRKALEFVIHFVGDVHQPLHTADHKDGGGNGVPVIYGNLKSPDTLHAYWDRHLVERLGRDPAKAAVALARSITREQLRRWSTGSTADWAEESHQSAKSVAYDFSGEASFVDDHGGEGLRLDAAYEARALPVVREQLSKAGVRLAALLNTALKR